MKPSIVNRIKSNWTLKRLGKVAMTVAFTLVIAIFLLAMLGTVVQAAGLVDDTVNVANEYSRYPLENYQLDFYVDNSWGWLPWNWSDGIGKQVMYGLYAITNFIWTISLYVSNATGYLVQEAYSLDFISATADSIGKNMQTLAGVSANGFSTEGFYVGFLLLLILVLGVYVAYTGLIKRETTKAIHAIMNFVLVFILYKIQEVDHQSKPPPLRKSVRNHEVENFSDWWFWIILDGLLTASVCCHFIFR